MPLPFQTARPAPTAPMAPRAPRAGRQLPLGGMPGLSTVKAVMGPRQRRQAAPPPPRTHCPDPAALRRCPGLLRTRLLQPGAARPRATTARPAVPGRGAGGRRPTARSAPPRWALLRPGWAAVWPAAAGCRHVRASRGRPVPPPWPDDGERRSAGGRTAGSKLLRLGAPRRRAFGSGSQQPRSGRGQSSRPR